MRPRLLDLFCGAGGAAMGYHRAGFDVVGVDIERQPNYPFDFIWDDALEYFEQHLVHGAVDRPKFDAIHASPPCQAYSDLQKQNKREYVDLIAPTRDLLQESGWPYVIENVEGAPLRSPVVLCGTMFPGLRVLRHRLFETNWPLVPVDVSGCARHPLVFTHDKRKAHYGKLDQDTSFVQVTGGGNCTIANKADAMGIDWMTGRELNEAIPPAYTEYIGRQLIEHVTGAYMGIAA
jgi:DNA (cytosine-5)-methyltransferase 1